MGIGAQRVRLKSKNENDAQHDSGHGDEADETPSRSPDVDRLGIESSDGCESDFGGMSPHSFMGRQGGRRIRSRTTSGLIETEAVQIVFLATHELNGSEVRCAEGRGRHVAEHASPTDRALGGGAQPPDT